MAILFSAVVPIPAGSHDFGPFPLANGMKSALIEFDGTQFPVGVTTVTLFFSFDGGATFPNSASGTYNGPASARFPTYRLGFELALQPNSVKANTNSPSAFSTQVTLNSA